MPDVGDGQGDDGRQASADADELQAKLGSAHKLGIGSYKTAWLIPAQAAQEHGASRWKKTVEVVEIAHRTKDDALGGGQGRRHFGKIFRRRGMPLQGGPDAIGNFAQDFFEVAVAYRRPRFLSGQIRSLLQRFQFPVPSSREFLCQHVDFTAARVMKSPAVQPLFSRFPVNFPVSREFLPADRFASDCLIRQIDRPTASDSIHLNPSIILHTAEYIVQWRREAPKTSCWHPTNLLVYLGAYQQLFGRDTNMPLTDTAVCNAKRRERPQKLSDGGGLHLLVNPDGARYWRMAYRYHRRQKTLALGVYPLVSLADARAARDAAKKLLARDIDPSEAKKEQKRAGRLSADNTFEIVAREWCENQKDGWTARYHDHVITRLEADVFPEIGARPIAEIEPPELLALLRKVEKRGALEIAKRLRQTVGQVFRYGIVTGRANRDPAVDLKGALKASGRQAHHKAMPREDLPEFLRALSNYDGEARTRLALRLAVLTFVRTMELRAVRWDEVDLKLPNGAFQPNA